MHSKDRDDKEVKNEASLLNVNKQCFTCDMQKLAKSQTWGSIGLIVLALFTLFAVIGLGTFGLHPEWLWNFPGAAPYYGLSFSLSSQFHIGLSFLILLIPLVVVTRWQWVPLFLWTYCITFAAEYFGTSLGIPFGDYEYTALMGPKILERVPYLIPVSWFVMGLSCYSVCKILFPSQGRLARIATSSLLLTSWDLALDPAMSFVTKYWYWEDLGPYYSMPLINFAGWFLTGLFFLPFFELKSATLTKLANNPIWKKWFVLFYLLQWFLPMGMLAVAGLWPAVMISSLALAAPFIIGAKQLAGFWSSFWQKTPSLRKISLFCGITLFATFSSIESRAAKESSVPYQIEKIYSVEISSSINPATLNYLEEVFEKIDGEAGIILFIRMNTPGGLVSVTKKILTLIGNSEFPVGVWVTPEGASATSAGSIIASGAHFIFMSPGTNIGAATPITMSGDIEQKDLRAKAINDLVALVEGLAQARGHNPEPFKEMITEGKSFTAQAALKKGIASSVINRQSDLAKSLQGKLFSIKGKTFQIAVKNPRLETLDMDWGQSLLNTLADPSLAYILFLIGIALLYFEFQAPGGFLAGSVGLVALILAGIGHQALPLNFGAMALVVLGVALLILEVYITSYGLLSLAGLGSLVFGSLFLFRSADGVIELPNALIFSVVLSVVIFLGLVGYVIVRDRKKNQGQTFFKHAGEHGKILRVRSQDNYTSADGISFFSYQIKIRGETWNAFSREQLVEGQHVVVLEKDPNNLELEITANINKEPL